MTVPTPDNLGIAVIATGRAEEPELPEPARALRQAGTWTELPSIKPGQVQPVQHDLRPTQTFAASRQPGDIAAFTRQMLNLSAAARGA